MKSDKSKILIGTCIFFLVQSLVLIGLLSFSYKQYKDSVNSFVYSVLHEVNSKYPDVTSQELVELLNGKDSGYVEELKKYGINEELSALLTLEQDYHVSLQYSFVCFLFFFGCGLFLFLFYFIQKEQKLKEITNYIKEINRRNYDLDIQSNGEGELSILKNEVYKTMVMLREESDQLKQEKLVLKNSISDISHQLKTPLTSILIMLDNILEHPDMDKKTREEFLTNAQHQVETINFLVVSLLKLSRLEADAVEFKKESICVRDLLIEAKKKVSVLSEIKGIEIMIQCKSTSSFVGDYHWELEAITNILKNAVEHSKENSKVDLCVSDNSLYTEICIRDYGVGMNQKDLRNLFTRFYKGENSSSDSIGIGLNLAKNIIEKDNGLLSVDSKKMKVLFSLLSIFIR